jgi:hypothetical protein
MWLSHQAKLSDRNASGDRTLISRPESNPQRRRYHGRCMVISILLTALFLATTLGVTACSDTTMFVYGTSGTGKLGLDSRTGAVVSITSSYGVVRLGAGSAGLFLRDPVSGKALVVWLGAPPFHTVYLLATQLG